MTDVVVVGGGVAGLCAAEGLARSGARVVCLEAETIGAGASGRGSGQLLLGVVEAPNRVLASLGEARTRELFDVTAASVGWLSERGLLERREQCSVALGEREAAELEQAAAVLDALGVPATLTRHAPWPGLDGPMLCVGVGGRVRPAPALRALAGGARAAGAEVREGAAVTGVEEGRDGLVVHVGEQRIMAEIVVWAAGIATRELEPALREPLLPVREQALELSVPPNLPIGGARAGQGYTWFELARPGGSEGVLLAAGGCRWATPHLEVGETEPTPEPRVQSAIERFAGRLGGEGAMRRWAWIEAHTCDNLPLVGPLPGQNRFVACTGFCGNDWGLGPGAAALVTEGLTGERSATSGLFTPGRFL